MYNEQIEQLISAALADGVLTEKEKQILFKKAQSMGIDLDEFEMVLDARLVELAKAEKAKAEASAPKSNKFGDIKKCPACGAIVQSFQGICPECGYAFENIEANSSSRKFAELIDKMIKEDESKSAHERITDSFAGGFSGKTMDTRIHSAIKNFPVPNTKADLLEFIFSMKTKMSDSNSLYADAYRIKYKECIEKAKFLFPDDKDFAPLLVENNKMNWWKSKSQMEKTRIIFLLVSSVIIISFFVVGISLLSRGASASSEKDESSKEILQALREGDTKEAVDIFLKTNNDNINTANSIVDACLSNDRFEEAMQIAAAVDAEYGEPGDNISSKLYEYSINHGDFEKAQVIYKTAYNSNRYNGKYIKDVVVYLCEKGEKEEAIRFLKIHQDEITKADELGKPKKVIKQIQEIIDSY